MGTQGTSHLSVWDLATQQKLYQAKGAKPNAIGLVDKPWDATVAYLVGDEGCRVAVGTGYHKVRVYDVKAQRRPVMEVSFGESRVTALTPDLDGDYFSALFRTGVLRRCAVFSGGVTSYPIKDLFKLSAS